MTSEVTAAPLEKEMAYPWEGAITTHHYDKDGNCIKTCHPNGSSIYMEYDAEGNLIKKSNPVLDRKDRYEMEENETGQDVIRYIRDIELANTQEAKWRNIERVLTNRKTIL